MVQRISLSESAVRDLQEVRQWYDSQSAPEVGERLVREILACLDQLAEFPERVLPVTVSVPPKSLQMPPPAVVS